MFENQTDMADILSSSQANMADKLIVKDNQQKGEVQ